MMKNAALLVILFYSVAGLGQTQHVSKNGNATASGICAVSHSGNNDVITIKNCGIGKEQADKIIQILKAVLANQKAENRDAKLDELLVLARRAANPYGTTTTYQPNGIRREVTLSLGKFESDPGALPTYKEMVAAEMGHRWNQQISLATQGINKYPGWFTPYAFLGQAQSELCMKGQAQKSLTQFISDTRGATAYQKWRTVARRILVQQNTEDYFLRCMTPKGATR